MSDFRLMAPGEPLLLPAGCAICGSTSGLVDTRCDFSPSALRLYLCRTHIKALARTTGDVKGDEMDALMHVREQLGLKEAEVEKHVQTIAEQKEGIQTLLAENDRLREEAAMERQKAEGALAQVEEIHQATGGFQSEPEHVEVVIGR